LIMANQEVWNLKKNEIQNTISPCKNKPHSGLGKTQFVLKKTLQDFNRFFRQL